MRQTLRRLYVVTLLLFGGMVIWLNARLYYSAHHLERQDVPAQLAFIRQALQAGAAHEMQRYFPEGYFFSYALYGLAWANWGLAHPQNRPQALAEARWALAALDAPAGRAVFSPGLNPPYGVFYAGWRGLLHGEALQLQPADQRDPADVERFQAACAALAQAFDASPSPFLMAYPGQSWPVDSVVALAALRLHDRLFPPRYAAMISRWLARAQARLDPTTGLLPHRTRPDDGALIEGARATSQSLINVFLPQIAPAWSVEQYAAFRRQFVTTVLGIPGALEYPAGAAGAGDVDSGPLIFGVSLSASVVTAAAAQANGDRALADALLDVGEALGMPLHVGEAKRYALGVLPIGDAFLAWAKSVPPAGGTPPPVNQPAAIAQGWRLPTHLISALVLLLLGLPVWRRRRA